MDCFNSNDERYCETDRHGNRVYRPQTTTSNNYGQVTTTAATAPGGYRPPHFQTDAQMVAWPMTGTNQRERSCNRDQFRCSTVHQCIPRGKVCDLQIDCVDQSDERGCKCLDYVTRLNSQNLCDGYPDCRDWEDERECNFCYDGQFYCDQASTFPKYFFAKKEEIAFKYGQIWLSFQVSK